MPACPHGHESTADDYCDICGTPMTQRAESRGQAVAVTLAAEPDETCPRCGGTRTGRFCEACGHDFTSPPPAVPTSGAPSSFPSNMDIWTAVVTVDPEAAEPPAYCPERTFPLDRPEVRIGRASRSRGLSPEIDLSGAPRDEGVSHLHAVLLAQPDGSWQVIDPGSTNGTRVNAADDSIATGVPTPLADGDTIHIGAWTMITLRRDR